jgi:RecA/RadA recombinase
MSGSARAVHITTLVKLEVWNVSDCSQTIVNTDSLLIDKKDTGIQLLQMCDYIFFK